MPPRKQKSKQPVLQPEPKQPELIRRRFVEASKISKYLNCSICQEVFNDPVMPPCQHTFCKVCLQGWTENQRAATVNCPVCRSQFRIRDLDRNLLAYQIVNDLVIHCTNLQCPWRGPLESITAHLPKCSYNLTADKPLWLRNLIEQQEEEY